MTDLLARIDPDIPKFFSSIARKMSENAMSPGDAYFSIREIIKSTLGKTRTIPAALSRDFDEISVEAFQRVCCDMSLRKRNAEPVSAEIMYGFSGKDLGLELYDRKVGEMYDRYGE